MRRSQRLTLVLGATLGALSLASCGDGGDGDAEKPAEQRAQVVEVVKRYQSAVLDGDGDAACDLIAGVGKRKLVVQLAPLGVKDCEGAVDKALDLAGKDELARVERSRDQLSEGKVRLNGRRATVVVGRRELQLERAAGEWLISDPFPARR